MGGISRMDMFKSLSQKIEGKKVKIVYPEATDPRVLGATCSSTFR